ncbi:MAG: type II toxin-antitoxin system prevent-host-death family antitoxin [Ignavibacteria bacterium]|jgi:prevent-host-death family protein
MQSVAVSELRANLVAVLEKIKKGSTINITSRGKVVAKLVPPDESKKLAEDILLQVRKNAKLHDVVSPVSEKWNVEN